MLILLFINLIVDSLFAENIEPLVFSKNARTFETQHSTLVTKALAHSCLTLTLVPDGLPCNPALVPLIKKPSLSAEFLLSNGLSSYEKVKSLVGGNFSQEVVDSLFSEGKILQLESNLDLNFISPLLTAQYSPMTVKGLSVIRNEANPEVDFYAIEESGFLLQGGYEVFDGFYLGLQTRFINRKFIKKRMMLVLLSTPEGRESLKPKEQKVTYIEPAMTWFIKKEWKPRISLMLVNSGTYSEKFEEMPTPVQLQGGIGISPPLRWGELELSLDYKSLTYYENELQKWHLGSLYKFGSMSLALGADSYGLSGGVFYEIDKLNSGIIYSTTRSVSENDGYYTQTVYVELGWKI